ncbi:MAG: hypothetical protein ACI9G1_001744, partial [Pirellulaceae bacterium]
TQPTGAQLNVKGDRQSLQCVVLETNSIGCRLARLEVHSKSLAGLTKERLREISAALSGKLSYLMEPIVPIEFDIDAMVAQLRSNPPRKEDTKTQYYELTLQEGGSIALRRFEKIVGEPRTAIPADITREVLMRLVDDLSESVS